VLWRLGGLHQEALATGSQLAAALVLAGPALLWRPAILPTPAAWLAAGLLALACTGIAYVLYFRLIAQIGPANAISVTFLIPVFGVLWGMWFLDEQVTLPMAAGCAVILLGTALTTGILKPRRRHAARA
jgi:drug/metabolite transporter (DMT)-like permease